MRGMDSILSQFISMKATTTTLAHAHRTHTHLHCWHFQFNPHTLHNFCYYWWSHATVPIHCFTFYSVIMVVREWHLFPAFLFCECECVCARPFKIEREEKRLMESYQQQQQQQREKNEAVRINCSAFRWFEILYKINRINTQQLSFRLKP